MRAFNPLKHTIRFLTTYLVVLCLAYPMCAQDADSLRRILSSAKVDTASLNLILGQLQKKGTWSAREADSVATLTLNACRRIKYLEGEAKAYDILGRSFYSRGEYRKALQYHKKSVSLLKRSNDSLVKAQLYQSMANEYSYIGVLDSATHYCQMAIRIFQNANRDEMLARSYNTLGGIYWNFGKFSNAAEMFFASLRIKEKSGDSLGMANSYNNLGIIFDSQSKLGEALDMYSKALKLYEALGNKRGIGRACNNIAIVYKNQGRYGESIGMYLKSLEIDKELNNIDDQGRTLNNIGELYSKLKSFDKALQHFNSALSIFESNGNDNGRTVVLVNLARTYQQLEDMTTAERYFAQALQLSKRIGTPEWTRDAYLGLYEISKARRSYPLALTYHELYKLTSDSLRNVENLNRLDELKVTYETERRDHEIALLGREKEIDRLAIQRQRTISWLLVAVVGSFIVVIVSISFVLHRTRLVNRKLVEKNAEILRQRDEIYVQRDQLRALNVELQQEKEETQAQHDQIEAQNRLIRGANQRLTENIEYAFRIQKALLPDLAILNAYFSNCFMLYRPKDIVSGDFYWFWPTQEELILATVDCTGHGVAGAFMSILAHNLLRDSVTTHGLARPSDIVSFICREVETNLYGGISRSEGKDGLDILVCAYNPHSRLLVFSGSQGSFTHLRGTTATAHKTDRYSIGSKINSAFHFAELTIELQQGDRLFFYTDGYSDQFSEFRKKKIGRSTLNNLLVNSAHEPLSRQKVKLENFLATWQGQSEQIDDILVWGVEV